MQVEATSRQNEPDLNLSVEEALNGIGNARAGNAAHTVRRRACRWPSCR
jgi:hypothetical protein